MDFRKMRRHGQELPQEETIQILQRNTAGVLAVLGDGGYPYAVPLSYVYQDGAIYFHCARSGHKLDALQNCTRASFCVTDQDRIVPEKYTTYFRSVIAFGHAELLTDKEEIHGALQVLGRKYAPAESAQRLEKEIAGSAGQTAVVKLTIEHMTGKEAVELVKLRNA